MGLNPKKMLTIITTLGKKGQHSGAQGQRSACTLKPLHLGLPHLATERRSVGISLRLLCSGSVDFTLLPSNS